MLILTHDVKIADKLQVKRNGDDFFLDPDVKLVDLKKSGNGVTKVRTYLIDIDEKSLEKKLTKDELNSIEKISEKEAKEKISEKANVAKAAKNPKVINTKEKLKK